MRRTTTIITADPTDSRDHPAGTASVAWGIVAVILAGAVAGAVVGTFPDLEVYRYGGRSVLNHIPGPQDDL